MPLEVGTNTFVSVVRVDSLLEYRIDAEEWTDAVLARKEKAAATATAILNGMDWLGVAAEQSQSLAFPREGTYYDSLVGANVQLSEIPLRIEKGTSELALHLLKNEDLLDETGSVDDIELGPIKLKDIQDPSIIPHNVYKLIRPLLIRGNSKLWWRAN